MSEHKSSLSSQHILSCDGGVIRGLLTAVLLEQLEEELKAKNPHKQLRDYFDIIAGTSTGSILACGIAKGIPAKEIKGLLKYNAIQIFPALKDTLRGIQGERDDAKSQIYQWFQS